MNIEIIKTLKERAKKMLEDNYDRKIGDEEIYTIICELENFYTAYEKEKEKNRQSKMRIVQLENEITARIEDVNQYYTPNDKIKAKIEFIKSLKEKLYYEENVISILQSLLEKEG